MAVAWCPAATTAASSFGAVQAAHATLVGSACALSVDITAVLYILSTGRRVGVIGWPQVRVCVFLCVSVCVCLCVCVPCGGDWVATGAWVCMFMCVSMCIYVCFYAYVCVCVRVYRVG